MRTALHQRLACRSLLAAAVTLALSPVAGTLLIDRCPMSARFPEANATVERWRSRVPPPQIVFLGSSRTHCAVGEADIESVMKRLISSSPPVFNAALPYGDPLTMRYLAAPLFAAGPMPRLAILEVTPQSLAYRHPFLDVLITRQFTITDIVATGGENFHSGSKAISRLFSSRLTPFYRHRRHLLAWMGEATGHPLDGSRWGGFSGPVSSTANQPTAPTPPPAAAIAMVGLMRIGEQLADYEVAGRPPEELEALVAGLREKGVDVLLLQTPVPSTIRALSGPEVMEKFRAFIEQLERSYGCRFVDISERITDSMFRDPMHVNTEGREYFSRILAEEILVPLLLAERQRSNEP